MAVGAFEEFAFMNGNLHWQAAAQEGPAADTDGEILGIQHTSIEAKLIVCTAYLIPRLASEVGELTAFGVDASAEKVVMQELWPSGGQIQWPPDRSLSPAEVAQLENALWSEARAPDEGE